MKTQSWLLSASVLFGLVNIGACLDDEGFGDDVEGFDGGLGFDDDNAFRALDDFPGITGGDDLCTGTLSDGYGIMRYCRNHSIYSNNSNVTRAIILIHGSRSNAKTQYYELALAEAGLENVNMTETDIIAPQFFRRWNNDPASNQIYDNWENANYYMWGSGWQFGSNSTTHTSRSTFDMVDHIIEELKIHRPNLETIVVAGQSAGGMFVDRYSVTSDVTAPGTHIRYWVANPYTYLWMDSTRPDATCNGYNDYILGLDNMDNDYPYMVGKSKSAIKQRSVTRDIRWTVAELDSTGDSNNCTYDAQGDDTVDRWYGHRWHIYTHCQNLGYSAGLCFDTVYDRHDMIYGAYHGFADSVESTLGHDILFN